MTQSLISTLPQYTLWAMFIGGFVAFLSPCVLPMLPVYTLYLVGEGSESTDKRKAWLDVVRRSLGLMLGFITLFTLLGAAAGLLGSAFANIDRGLLNIITGVLLILFGVWTAGFLHWKGMSAPKWADKVKIKPDGFFSAALFGIVIALSWTPCITPVLANALVLAASSATVGQGMLSLAIFALGLSLPMLLLMVLFQWLKDLFTWLRDHQPLLRRIGGLLMIAYGVWLLVSTLI